MLSHRYKMVSKDPSRAERTTATDYLGPFLLTNLLKEPLAAARGRIGNISSDGHRSMAEPPV